VLEKRTTAVTGIDGRIPVVMALAARKSYDERRPVRMDEVGG
jgi:myo-inositol 2-dehydrogenase/D-chiro-inositol 1-dehydrogenase